MKRLLTLLSWMLLLQTSVSAQHDGIIWNYEHLSRNDGLSGNRVTALCDDMYGRIWIGTDGDCRRSRSTTVWRSGRSTTPATVF